MKKINAYIYLLILTMISSNIASAYDFASIKKKKKSKNQSNQLIGIGWGAFLSGGLSGDYTYYDKDTNDVNEASVSSVIGLDLIFIGAQYHYTLKKLSKEKSISIHAFPTLGLNVQLDDEEGFGGIQFPVFINYNYGAGSSYQSKEDYGLTCGIGVEYIGTSLISLGGTSNQYHSSDSKRKNIIQPAINLGYRYINDNDKIREWNFKLGYLPRTTADKFGNVVYGSANLPSIWGRLSLTYYID